MSYLWIRACGIFLVLGATALAASAQTFTTLASFDGVNTNNTNAGLLQGLDGNFYGTTVYGGPANNGTIFKVTPSGILTVVHSLNGTDGSEPFSRLVLGTDGNLYGTTNYGGASGDGTIYKFSGSTLTTLYSFSGGDGLNPQGGMVQGADGNLYGTTLLGGTFGIGTAFKISTSGVFTTLHFFSDGVDGGLPYDTLMQGSDAYIYGTTFTGGGADEGTVFKMAPDGTLTTLHNFCLGGIPCPDGGNTVAGLVQGTDGYMYGATARGGDGACTLDGYEGCGVVFKVRGDGKFNVLHLLKAPEGAGPWGSLALGTDGNFYGTTYGRGADEQGTIFEVSPVGVVTNLHNFDGADGSAPTAGALIQGTNGAFYGTTSAGGTNGAGTVFKLSMGLGPFVTTLPGVGSVGLVVDILGTNLAGATSVTFNGIPTPFTVVSPSWIKTTVPPGASTGSVQVTLPSGTLASNVGFRVKP